MVDDVAEGRPAPIHDLGSVVAKGAGRSVADEELLLHHREVLAARIVEHVEGGLLSVVHGPSLPLPAPPAATNPE